MKALEQIYQAMIVLSRKVQESRQPRSSGIKAPAVKVGGLSVLSQDKRSQSSDKAGGGKILPSVELQFLCEFAVDIVFTLYSTLNALRDSVVVPLHATGLLW